MKTKSLLSVLGTALMLVYTTGATAESVENRDAPCLELVAASCDLLWDYHKVRGKDYCTNVFDGKRGKFTIPKGTIGILGDPQIHGWDLRMDVSNKRDYWCKIA